MRDRKAPAVTDYIITEWRIPAHTVDTTSLCRRRSIDVAHCRISFEVRLGPSFSRRCSIYSDHESKSHTTMTRIVLLLILVKPKISIEVPEPEAFFSYQQDAHKKSCIPCLEM